MTTLHNRMGLGPSITQYTTGEVPMARVATKTQFVEDVHGVRRQIIKGHQVPPGLFDLDKVETEEAHVRTLARPIVDEAASQPAGTAAEPDAGISLEASEALRQDARKQARPARGTAAAKKQEQGGGDS